MEYRNGTCGDCNANYKIPASFTHDRARCKECGGTVTIGPPESGGSSAGDSDLEPYVPSGKKRSGPSMKERLLAQRRAEADKAQPKKAAAPPADDIDLDDDVEEPAPKKKAPARKTAARPARGKAGAGARRAKKDAADDDSEEVSKTASKRAGRSGGGRGRGRSGGGKRREKSGGDKKMSAPIVIGLVGLLILVGAGGYFFKDELGFGGSDPVDAASKDTTSETADDTTEGATGADPEAAEATTDDATPVENDAAEDAGADDAAAADPEPAEEAAEAEPAAPSNSRDPASVDLSVYFDFQPVDGTSTEEWADIQDKVLKAMDPDIGIAQVRAQKFLEENGRKAFPAILNYLTSLDLSSEDGAQKGMWSQRMLENICNGNNFGWKEYMEDAEKNGDTYFHWFNKKVVAAWCKAWEQAESNLDAWKNLAKLSDADFEKLKSSLGDSAPEPSELDLLNED